MRRNVPLTLLLLIILSLVTFSVIAADTRQYLVSVLPQMPAADLDRNWAPFIEKLSREMGVSLKLKYYKNMTDFESDLESGVPDFAFMTPPQAVIARKATGYIPLVRSSREISGVVIVRKDSPIQSMDDLSNKTIAYVGTHNVCSILVRDALENNSNVQMKQLFAGNTANMYKHVLLRKADAGATLDVELGQQPAEMASQLRTILQTRKSPAHPLSAHPRVPQKVRNALISAVISIGTDNKTAGLLKTVRLSEPVRADYARDYKRLEMINIRKLSNTKE